MCGIVGLFLKTPKYENQLGELLAPMMVEMTERGPDSAGFAVYRNPVADGKSKVTVLSTDPTFPWDNLKREVVRIYGDAASVEVNENHAVVIANTSTSVLHAWLLEQFPGLVITSFGSSIEVFKEKGLPDEVNKRFGLKNFNGTHALGHTRMATESAVSTEHSHPFATGDDVCLIHNGSLASPNRLRRILQNEGIHFSSDNDTEVAAGFIAWRLNEGDTLDEAMQAALETLDGFYTFVIGTKDGFAVLRDPVGCKPAVMVETDDYVAIASEYRALATLPGAGNAKSWEPQPSKIYSWSH